MNLDINIFNDSSYKKLPKKKIIAALEKTFTGENILECSINVIFMDDESIKDLNNKFLKHDYTTDVISFSLGEECTEGEIYISVDTATKQASEYSVSLTNELSRLAVHGALHIIGYDDNTEENANRMHDLENKYIN